MTSDGRLRPPQQQDVCRLGRAEVPAPALTVQTRYHLPAHPVRWWYSSRSGRRVVAKWPAAGLHTHVADQVSNATGLGQAGAAVVQRGTCTHARGTLPIQDQRAQRAAAPSSANAPADVQCLSAAPVAPGELPGFRPCGYALGRPVHLAGRWAEVPGHWTPPRACSAAARLRVRGAPAS